MTTPSAPALLRRKVRASWPTNASNLADLADWLKAHSLDVVTHEVHHSAVAVTVCWPSQRDHGITVISVDHGDDRDIWFATGTADGRWMDESELIAPARPGWDAVQAVRARLRR